jgi:tRNA (cytidine32/uridine32-2'-O)-methyltransferase
MNKENITFILVRPNFLGNIGGSARVMKNFGFGKLALVKPPRNYMDAEARKMAVDAFDVLKGAQVFDSLTEALKNISLAIGNELPRTLRSITTELETKALTETNRVAFVFGDERDGLSREELALCHELLHIPSQKDFPSLNLAQALGIVAYDLSQTKQTEHAPEAAAHLPDGEEADEFYALVNEIMDAASFSRRYNQQKVCTELRSALQRMRPDRREIKLLTGFLLTLRGRLKSDCNKTNIEVDSDTRALGKGK